MYMFSITEYIFIAGICIPIIGYYAFRAGVRIGAELTIKRLIQEKYIRVNVLGNGDLEFIRHVSMED